MDQDVCSRQAVFILVSGLIGFVVKYEEKVVIDRVPSKGIKILGES